MASLGQELKRERELRGISLKEIANSTKISLRLLRALEDDQLEILPGKFFTKGIIRAYAKYLGLEEESVLNKYYEDSLLPDQTVEYEKKKREIFKFVHKDIRKLLQYVILIIVIFLIAFSFYLFFPKKEKKVVLEQTPIPNTNQEKKLITSFLSPLSKDLLPEKKEISLDINFIEKTWIQVYADGKLELNGIKNPGEKVKIRASDEIIIHLGNAGGLTYTLNQKKGKPFGRRGAVVKNIKINLDNLQQFFMPQKEFDKAKKEGRLQH